MRLILTSLITLTCLAILPTPAHCDFTQADRERMIQIITKVEEIDKRFEQIDKRFEQMDKRLDDLRTDTNKRFEEMRTDTNKRFEELRGDMNKRSEQIDKRFEELREDMNARFEQVNNQFTSLTNLMMAIIGAFVAIVVMSIGFAYWDRRTMLRPLEEEVVRMKKAVSGKVEVQLHEVTTKVASLEKQVAQTSEAEAGKRRRIQEALAEMGSKGGEDARLAAIFRGML